MSTAPKVKLLTQPTDVIYSALFKGDMNRLLPKITSFLVWLFGFLIFFGLFQIFWKAWKIIKVLYSYRLGGDECQWKNKLVTSSRTCLCWMQGHMCRIVTLRGKSPPGKNRESSCKGYTKWICMARHEISLGYMDDTQSQGSWHKAQWGRKNSW